MGRTNTNAIILIFGVLVLVLVLVYFTDNMGSIYHGIF